ncbi:hypothetical protein M9Y10_032613 [Tritrichomonas musculus]|uniref:Small GTP-binding protein n=1 Tax=Tritrichomonas musculus TaxID=1915356 RepID=A0ABR2GYY9_9EUKA
MSKKQTTLEIIVCGNDCVGKTSLISRFIEEKFESEIQSTNSYYYKTKVVNIDGDPVKLEVWDSVVREKFHSFTRAYKRGADGILVVFDVCAENGLSGVGELIEKIKKECPRATAALVGNRCDLTEQRKVTKEEAESFAHERGLRYFETSAKENEGLDEVFDYVARQSYLSLQ